jgi:NAD(P)-dependent dehydrogenase (short-subunit alcohol dehydrogenase family)
MRNPFHLQGKNIVITGASSGIGRQCAIECSELGANIILLGRNTERLETTYDQLEKGGIHTLFSLDINEFEKLENTIALAAKNSGRIYGFIHAAGIDMTLPIKNTTYKIYNQLFATNVIAGFELGRIISNKKYLAEEGGSFIYISSVMGSVGQPGKIAYCSSKGALIAGTKAMALEFATKKLRVNCVSPAMVNTEMTTAFFNSISEESKNEILKQHPLGFGMPEDVAWACAYLLSDASKWVTGTDLTIDGGYSAK